MVLKMDVSLYTGSCCSLLYNGVTTSWKTRVSMVNKTYKISRPTLVKKSVSWVEMFITGDFERLLYLFISLFVYLLSISNTMILGIAIKIYIVNI